MTHTERKGWICEWQTECDMDGCLVYVCDECSYAEGYAVEWPCPEGATP